MKKCYICDENSRSVNDIDAFFNEALPLQEVLNEPKSMPRIKDGFQGERIVVLPRFLVEELQQDILGRELHITDIGYYPHAEFHYCERTADEAREFVLIYCVEGKGWFKLNNRVYNVAENQFFILPRNKPHAYGSDTKDPWTIYWIHFNGAKAEFFSAGFAVPHSISPAEHSRIQERLMLFEEIYAAISSGFNKSYMLYATTSLFHFLGSMKFLGEYRECRFVGNPNMDNIVQRAIHYMRENLRKKIKLEDIAREVKLSASYFSGIFQKETGSPPLKYLNFLRIQEACHYLDFTDMKINQISPLVGLEDTGYFSRLFTKVMGLSPTAYKARKKG